MKNRFLPFILAILAMLLFSFGTAFAQEIDVDSMNDEQLTALLLQILSKLQQEEEPEAVPETPGAAEAVHADDPGKIEEVLQITIYDNKKLTIDALPGYMFIRPSSPGEPEPESGPESGPEAPGTMTRDELESYCTGICMGYSDFYGINMLDMGCYAKCVGDI